MAIKIEHLSYVYLKKTPNEVEALRDVSLEIPENKITAIVGHTGSGKSTLIQTLNGLIIPTSGKITYKDFVISSDIKKLKKIKELRKHISIVFQFPEYQLFEETVEKDVAFGLKNYGYKEEEAILKAHDALKLVGLDESFYKRSPFELSGGEKRRVAIAGIIAIDPEVLILDEPTAGLDPLGSKIILDLIVNLNKNGKTIIIVTHDMGIVLNHADHVIVINEGNIAFEGSPSTLFSGDVSNYSIDIPPLFSFCKLLESHNVNIDINKIRTVDDLFIQLKEILK
ncbi:MAG: energy-coupling factor transporter ATPase [Bacilli bacterium]|nr:energy-coupling factor transporter ATPase [Bacilli bacterium]